MLTALICVPNNPSALFDSRHRPHTQTEMAKTKDVTREEAERKKEQAATFMERIGQSDRAEEFDDMSVDEYAEHKGLRLSNPNPKRKRITVVMATKKADLQDQIDRAIEVLDDAYAPETTREDLASAIGSSLDILRGDDEEEDTEDSDDDDSDDTDDEAEDDSD
jgi:hypothetical protein